MFHFLRAVSPWYFTDFDLEYVLVVLHHHGNSRALRFIGILKQTILSQYEPICAGEPCYLVRAIFLHVFV